LSETNAVCHSPQRQAALVVPGLTPSARLKSRETSPRINLRSAGSISPRSTPRKFGAPRALERPRDLPGESLDLDGAGIVVALRAVTLQPRTRAANPALEHQPRTVRRQCPRRHARRRAYQAFDFLELACPCPCPAPNPHYRRRAATSTYVAIACSLQGRRSTSIVAASDF